MKDYQGGFSDGVFKSRSFQQYIKLGIVFGYIGASGRTIRKDQFLEKTLGSRGLGNEGIATWLTSKDGRHLMDWKPQTLKAFKKEARDFTKNAFVNVTVWSHPDHSGMYRSTRDLRDKLHAAFTK